MNIEELKKIHECCFIDTGCKNCPLGHETVSMTDCFNRCSDSFIKIVDEQQKEINTLKENILYLMSNSQIEVSKKLETEIKKEAIEEFFQYLNKIYPKCIDEI